MKRFFFHDPYLLIYGFVIVFFASYGQTFYIALFNNDIRNFYGLTDGQFGLVYAVATLLSSFLFINFAKLIDKIELRIYSTLIIIGLALACIGFNLIFDNIIHLFIILFLLRFFGQGAMHHAGSTSMARYFAVDRGKAISVATLGGMLGIMFLPKLVVSLQIFLDFKSIWLYSALSLLLLIPLVSILLFDQKKRDLKLLKNIGDKKINKQWTITQILSNRIFFIYLPLALSSPFIGTGLMFHQISIFDSKGWSIEMIGDGYLIFGLCSILGLIVGGPLIDKINTKRAIPFVLLPLLISVILLCFFNSYFAFVIYMSLFGFNLGLSAPFMGSLWTEIYGVKSIGTAKGLFHGVAVLASALSPVIFGYAIDWGFGIVAIFIISSFMIIVSAVLPIVYKT
tara:strand:+ start:286 stop:1476 length:1191 start_codon:yes stop_codon:yes gene_type:complete